MLGTIERYDTFEMPKQSLAELTPRLAWLVAKYFEIFDCSVICMYLFVIFLVYTFLFVNTSHAQYFDVFMILKNLR